MKNLFSPYTTDSASDRAFQHGFSFGETVCRHTMYICDKLENTYGIHLDYEVAKHMWAHFSEYIYCATWITLDDSSFGRFLDYYGFENL